jgi:hypothetical protein
VYLQNRTIHIVQNVIPLHFSPLLEDAVKWLCHIGTILAKDKWLRHIGETIEQINTRKLKMVCLAHDEECDIADDGWQYVKVLIRSGSSCYCYTDLEIGEIIFVFTKAHINVVYVLTL